jgi:hypothetical protein
MIADKNVLQNLICFDSRKNVSTRRNLWRFSHLKGSEQQSAIHEGI